MAGTHPRTQNSKGATQKWQSLQYLSEVTVRGLSPRKGAQGLGEVQCSHLHLLLWEGFKGADVPESHFTFSHF